MKLYYTQDKISTSFSKFFKFIFSLSKPHLKVLSFILTGMISAESVVSADISRKLKDDFSLVNLESIPLFFFPFALADKAFPSGLDVSKVNTIQMPIVLT